MRTAVSLLVPTLSVLALLGCNPPLEENIAPFVEIISPRITFDNEVERAIGYVGANVTFDLILRDRDGDDVFDVRVLLDDVEVAVLLDAPADTAIQLVTDTPLPAGTSSLELQVDDRNRDGVRSRVLTFDPIPSDIPVVCWNNGAVCTTTPGAMPDTNDLLEGTLPNADVTVEYYERFWRDQNDIQQGVQPGSSGALASDQTAKNDVWEYCVERWVADDGMRPLDENEQPYAPDLTVCVPVTIGNTAPEPPPNVDIEPGRPLPGTSVTCVHDEATDADAGDALTYGFTWTDPNGTAVGTNIVLDQSLVLADLSLICTVVSIDADGAESSGSPSVATGVRPTTQSTGALGLNNSALYGTNDELVFTAPASAVPGELSQHAIARPDAADGTVAFANNALAGNAPFARIAGSTGARLGQSLSSAQFDSDGVQDLLIGSNGAAWLVLGDGVTANVNVQPVTAVGQGIRLNPTDSGFGQQAVFGDLTSAINLDAAVSLLDTTVANRVYVVSGNDLTGTAGISSSLDAATTPYFIAAAVDDTFGAKLVTGNVTGDDRHDLVVGNPSGSTPTAVYVFSAESVHTAVSANDSLVKLARDATRPALGSSLALADLDADGIDDLIVGSPDTDEVGVFFGATLGTSLTFADADVLITGETGSGFGSRVYAHRSVFAGTRDAFVVDAPAAAGATGRVSMFEGGLFQLTTTALDETDAGYTVNGTSTASPIQSLRLAGPPGDLDGDGFPDLSLVATASSGPSIAYFVRSSN